MNARSVVNKPRSIQDLVSDEMPGFNGIAKSWLHNKKPLLLHILFPAGNSVHHDYREHTGQELGIFSTFTHNLQEGLSVKDKLIRIPTRNASLERKTNA